MPPSLLSPGSLSRATARLLPAVLLLCCLSCARVPTVPARTPLECSALEGYGLDPSAPDAEPASAGSRRPLEDRVAEYQADPTHWAQNLGFSMALERLREGWRVTDSLPPEAVRARQKSQELYRQVVMSGAEIVTVAMHNPLSSRDGAPFNTVAVWLCGRNFPLYEDPMNDLEGVLVSPDRGHLAVVHVGGRQYVPYDIPLALLDVSLDIVDLRTFIATHLPLGKAGTHSIALAWSSPTRLQVRLKALRGPHQDERSYVTYDLAKASPAEPLTCTPDEGELPQQGVLEVTSLSAYQLEPLPAGFQAPDRLVARSVHVSPDRRWVSFVTDDENGNKLFDSTRHLWVQSLSAPGGAAVEVTHEEGPLHARWLDAEQLVFELPMQPPPQFIDFLKTTPQDSLSSYAEFEEAMGDARLAPEEKKRLKQNFAFHWAVRQTSPDDPMRLGKFLDLPLWRYSVRTRETTRFHPGPARLWTHLGGPTSRHQGSVREQEVPIDRGPGDRVPFQACGEVHAGK